MFYVYVIKSQSTGKTYIGQTADLQKRLTLHNDPNNRLTLHTKRNKGPWILIYSEEYQTRSEAVLRERFLKSGQGREYLKSIIDAGC
jgi:putative endonuclease